jgi:hypothetical protein
MKKPTAGLNRVDCTVPGTGPWYVLGQDMTKRSVKIRHRRNGLKHHIYYGTRTGRTMEDSMALATALCAMLNLIKAKSL